MQEMPTCPNCCNDLSSYFDLFMAIREKKVRDAIKKEDGHIDTIDVIENKNISFEKDFEKLGFEKLCCRIHLTTAVNFYDHMK